MLKYFAPKPGRFGVAPAIMTAGQLATGTLAAGTLNFNLGTYPGVTAYVLGAAMSALTWATAANSMTAQLIKYDASADAEVNLTGLVDINNLTDSEGVALPLSSTLTDAQRLMDVGDILILRLVTTGAVSVQPAGLNATVEVTPLH